ncbi:QcrA and Rieske domain-containing protein [Flavobacterium flavipallidum]|uniref:Rieske 2Fe-2S domain-containing protein n=1 Tax=Flavobacterium flavipallidum TaxID=3139140 RepID=A0ABU9HMD1_9FLAO
MNRKEFFARVGFGAASLLVPACISGLAISCSSEDGSVPSAPTGVDFTLDISSGALATDKGYLVKNGIIIARENSTTFLAVSAACTHEGTTVNYVGSSNTFHCPNHGSNFSSTGTRIDGPASTNLKQYNVSLTGNTLRVYS